MPEMRHMELGEVGMLRIQQHSGWIRWVATAAVLFSVGCQSASHRRPCRHCQNRQQQAAVKATASYMGTAPAQQADVPPPAPALEAVEADEVEVNVEEESLIPVLPEPELPPDPPLPAALSS